jgi:hypothetical protein
MLVQASSDHRQLNDAEKKEKELELAEHVTDARSEFKGDANIHINNAHLH